MTCRAVGAAGKAVAGGALVGSAGPVVGGTMLGGGTFVAGAGSVEGLGGSGVCAWSVDKYENQ